MKTFFLIKKQDNSIYDVQIIKTKSSKENLIKKQMNLSENWNRINDE